MNRGRTAEFKRSGDRFTLAAIQCELALEDIYEKVTFDQSLLLNGQSH